MTPGMKTLKRKLSITLDYTVIDEIKELAEKDDRSVSQYVNLILRRHLKQLEKKREAESK
ncbi:toxin-antitoxin system protein [Murimonas intestini]|uniref:Ribbon-helix-helix protein, CopG family n=2 Tax=Murimonas intestini TaxID=1337051 RepID=A0AB73T9F8_9FIRM|nr:toxin-antitoxin system protein [Murimonas intestini]